MLKAAIERILELAGPKVIEVAGLPYSDRLAVPVRGPTPAPIQLDTLTSLVHYIRSGLDDLGPLSQCAVIIEDARGVRFVSALQPPWFMRHEFATVVLSQPGFKFGQWFPQEEFLIGLRTLFQPTKDREDLILLASVVSADEIRTVVDNGISQELTAKAGLIMADRAKLPPSIPLRPFRTFREIKQQPESSFIVRARDGGGHRLELALHEADGGAWALEAVGAIKEYLAEMLPEELPILA